MADNVAKTWKPLLASINPIEVAEVLSRVGGITELPTLLHDTIEDTETAHRIWRITSHRWSAFSSKM
jgi:hypothetical protein